MNVDADIELEMYNNGFAHGRDWVAGHPGQVLHRCWAGEWTTRLITHPDLSDLSEFVEVLPAGYVAMNLPKSDPFTVGMLDAFHHFGVVAS